MVEQEPQEIANISGMRPVTLEALIRAGDARIIEIDGHKKIEFTIHPGWAYGNETRIGDATLGRLFECIRQLHVRQDISPTDDPITVVTSEEEFRNPVAVGSKVIGDYDVVAIGNRSHTVRFTLTSPGEILLSQSTKTFVHLDDQGRPTPYTPQVKQRLIQLRARDVRKARSS